jgi:hypothetical protein
MVGAIPLRPPVIFKIAAIAVMFKPSFDPDNSTFGLVFELGIVVHRSPFPLV